MLDPTRSQLKTFPSSAHLRTRRAMLAHLAQVSLPQCTSIQLGDTVCRYCTALHPGYSVISTLDTLGYSVSCTLEPGVLYLPYLPSQASRRHALGSCSLNKYCSQRVLSHVQNIEISGHSCSDAEILAFYTIQQDMLHGCHRRIIPWWKRVTFVVK